MTAQPPAASPMPILGYIVLYVQNVAATLEFYQRAFGLKVRFFNDDKGKAYGELDTGTARIAFYSLELVREQWQQPVQIASLSRPPLGFEIALVTPDVRSLFDRAVNAGATAISPPQAKPWGQMVAILRDRDGLTIDLCTPLP